MVMQLGGYHVGMLSCFMFESQQELRLQILQFRLQT